MRTGIHKQKYLNATDNKKLDIPDVLNPNTIKFIKVGEALRYLPLEVLLARRCCSKDTCARKTKHGVPGLSTFVQTEATFPVNYGWAATRCFAQKVGQEEVKLLGKFFEHLKGMFSGKLPSLDGAVRDFATSKI